MKEQSIYPRVISSQIEEAQNDTPVIFLSGPRQAGKTTLVREIASKQNIKYLTLDDELTLLSAKQDPTAFIRDIDRVVIDEIQRAPELLLSIKKSVDEDRRPGRFLLTGSANIMSLPMASDSLAGRMENLSIFPLSQSEIREKSGNWVDQIFSGSVLEQKNPIIGSDLVECVLCGGYPEAISRKSVKRRTTWFRNYTAALVNRDVRDIANIEKLDQLPRFLRALAQSAGQMCNYKQLGAEVGLDGKTAAKYIGIFEKMYLLKRIDVWAKNHLNRIVKTAKLQFLDSGLLSSLMDLSANEVKHDRSRFGNVLETFVYSEILKHISTADGNYQIMYYRDKNNYEVDFVLENSTGDLVGVEVKAAATIKEHDLKGLRKFAMLSGDKFKKGVIFYDDKEKMPLGNNIWSAPISSLWGQ